MKRTCLGFTLVSLILILGASSSRAQTQISLGASNQVVTFTSSGGPGSAINAVFSPCGSPPCGAGNFQQGVVQTSGNYTFTESGGTITMTSINGGATFDVQMNGATLAFSWTSGSNFLTGNLTLTSASDNTPSPRFVGTLLVTGVSAGLYSTFWPAGDTVNMDFTLTLGSNPTLENVFNHTTATSTSGSYSSGQVLPAPEPISVALFGSGLIMVGGILRRRSRK
jgi:hypothetical protein